MRHRHTEASRPRAALWGALLLLIACRTQAEPARLGLVIGNGAYTAFPALPACVVSARDLTTALSGLGYQVIDRQDVSSGGMAAAIDEFARGMAAAPDASVVVYVCGYAAGMNDRPFLLPVSANLRRPSDVMTQGLLAKAILDTLVRGNPSRGILALDLVTVPDAAAPVPETLKSLPLPAGVGLIAVTAAAPTTGSTALSVALTAGLAAPGVGSADLLTAVEDRLGGPSSSQITALRRPLVARPLPTDAPSAPAADQPVAPQSVPPGAALVDAAPMTAGELRRIQEALARLGYYGARTDGRFGPETRAAIRRFQHEIGAPLTGTLTGEQAARLLAGG